MTVEAKLDNIPILISRWAKRTPLAPALIFGRRITNYGLLDHMAEAYSVALQRFGIDCGMPVGISGPRSPELVACLLALLKVGAPYVPLDHRYPAHYSTELTRNSNIDHFLTVDTAGTVFVNGNEVFPVETKVGLEPKMTGEDLAMVVYTSGSQGPPKGVMITHGAVLARLEGPLGYASENIGCFQSSIAVIAHVSALLLPLMRGQAVLLPYGETGGNTFDEALLKTHGAARVAVTPTYLKTLIQDKRSVESLASLKTLVIHGESIPNDLLQEIKCLLPNVSLINAYGTTETTGLVTFAQLNRAESIVIARGGLPSNCHIVDSELRPLPVGSIGELCVSGRQLAAGYWGEVSHTSERFVQAPWTENDVRIFRTGDLVRYTVNGDLEIVGRMDNIVKIKGWRVNTSDVERILEGHEMIITAVVYERGGRLVAHLQSKSSVDQTQLRRYCRENMPEYMIPSSFLYVDSLPLLPSGKIDRQSICPDVLTPTETRVKQIWVDTFEDQDPRIDDNFFDLGGDSLLAMRISSRIEVEFNVQIALEDMLDYPTIQSLSRLLDCRRLN